MMPWLSDKQFDEDADATNLPETPAPLFALRALKSTIFGSPEVNLDEIDQSWNQAKKETSGRRISANNGKGKGRENLTGRTRTPTKSPAKSILVTPGTRKSERKMVAFRDAPSRMTATENRTVPPPTLHHDEIETSRSDNSKPLDPTEAPEISSPTPRRHRGSRTPLREIDPQTSPSPKERQKKSSPGHSISLTNPSSNQRRKHITTSPKTNQELPRRPTPTSSSSSSSGPILKTKPTTTLHTQSHTHRNHPISSSTPSISTSRSARDHRHLVKLLHRYEIVKQYAKMKDDEANELAIQVRKLEEENKKLLRELAKLKEETHKGLDGEDAAIFIDDKETGKVGAARNQQALPSQAEKKTKGVDPAAWMVSRPKKKATDRASSSASNKQSSQDDPRPGSLPKTNGNCKVDEAAMMSAKVPNLPPERLAAAKARLKVKAEERKRRAGV